MSLLPKNKKLTILTLFLLTLGAIFLRSIPLKGININDIQVHYDWSKTLYQQNLRGIYFYDNWLYTPLTQPPLMTLGFWFSRHIYENRYLLSELHNLIKIPPTSFILWFDQYGEFLLLRLWAIIGDIVSAFLIFYLINKYKKSFKLALLAFIFMLFNPISLFESWVWGQNDIISIVFVYLSFLVINKKNGLIFSPLLYLIGLLIKPTCLVLLPFYIVFFFTKIKINKINIAKLFISLFLSITLIFVSFKPFLTNYSHPVSEITNIVIRRMSSSSKGLSRASNSAFNFFSLFFTLDKTYGGQKLFNLKLDTIGLFSLILINILGIIFYFKKKSSNKFVKLMFLLFFISQGTFLFVTGMLERYFLPAFIASIFLMFSDFKNFGVYMILQNLVWFLNLFYSFFQRQIGWIKMFFESNHFLLVKLLSLANLILFYLIVQKFLSLRKYSSTKSQD